MKALLIILSLSTVAQASPNIVMSVPRSGPKNVPAVYVTGVSGAMDQAKAAMAAINGTKVYKCQEVVLTMGKSSLSLKPAKQ